MFRDAIVEDRNGLTGVMIGSWTGPPREERAPRVGISSTVFGIVTRAARNWTGATSLLLFVITLKPTVERHTKSMSLEYEPASKPPVG